MTKENSNQLALSRFWETSVEVDKILSRFIQYLSSNAGLVIWKSTTYFLHRKKCKIGDFSQFKYSENKIWHDFSKTIFMVQI